MVTVNRNAIAVLPKETFLQWLHAVDPTSAELSPADLREDPTIYLVAECAHDEAVELHACRPFRGAVDRRRSVTAIGRYVLASSAECF